MDHHAVFQPRRDVSGMAHSGVIPVARILQRKPGQDRHAVIALLPARHHMLIAERAESLYRDLVDRGFALLKAENIGGLFTQQALDQPGTQPDRIDIPGVW